MEPTATPLSSMDNGRVKQGVKLRQRSHRDRLGLLLIEGARETERALRCGWTLSELFFCRDCFPNREPEGLLARAADKGIELLDCTEPVFRKMAYRQNPDGILAVAPQRRLTLDELDLREPALVVVAEAVEKPGNLGTILRSADGAGVDAVLVCDRCTDIHNPNVVRASMGALFSLPVVEIDSDTARSWLSKHSVQVVATTPHADLPYFRADLRPSTAIVVGAEQSGLTSPWLEHADVRVQIPMKGLADSLNVASATTLLLYEVLRQREG